MAGVDDPRNMIQKPWTIFSKAGTDNSHQSLYVLAHHKASRMSQIRAGKVGVLVHGGGARPRTEWQGGWKGQSGKGECFTKDKVGAWQGQGPSELLGA